MSDFETLEREADSTELTQSF